MKKTLCILLALGLMCPGLAFAITDDASGGLITLTDQDAARPGCIDIPVSRNAFVSYSAESQAGGYAAGSLAGQVMCVTSGHPDANPDDALYFGVRGSQESDQTTYPDDNRVYQSAAAGTAVTQANVTDWCTGTAITNWYERGSGGGT